MQQVKKNNYFKKCIWKAWIIFRQQIQRLAGKLQIQTDNICQFLPQDVVRKFAEQSSQDRFIQTLRAVGDGETLEKHEHLGKDNAHLM